MICLYPLPLHPSLPPSIPAPNPFPLPWARQHRLDDDDDADAFAWLTELDASPILNGISPPPLDPDVLEASCRRSLSSRENERVLANRKRVVLPPARVVSRMRDGHCLLPDSHFHQCSTVGASEVVQLLSKSHRMTSFLAHPYCIASGQPSYRVQSQLLWPLLCRNRNLISFQQ